ncbi:hypothetical protein AB0L34_01750 [Micromonospora sp. NPDC052213]|uniref:hypothetical protein n=1 Tax=Micromonospora sp. NPDC052213 TaxID=3155812 RepID=UPI00342D5103
MTGLRELFEDAAGSSARPSRLTANEVYDAGRRRHRRRLAAATVAGATALTLVAVAAVNLLAPVPPPVDGTPIAGQPTTTGNPDPASGRRIRWALAADRNHLYLSLSTCTNGPCQSKQTVALVGSTDGGRTWSDRGAPITVSALAVLGPDTLIAAVPGIRPGADLTLLASLDGGRTWAAARSAGTAEAVPAGGTAICWSPQLGTPCTLHAVDPATHGVAPLAEQPPLTMRTDALQIEESAGRLRVAGTDPVTGRPAVSTSTDAGRSWSTHVFADAPACPEEKCEAPLLAVTGTATTYATTTGGDVRAVYRSDGTGGRWQRLTDAHLPDEPATNGSFVTADGTHVLFQLVNGRNADARRYWAARDGGAYQAVELVGLPTTAGPVRRTPDGWFYASDDAVGTLYGSTDGWRWSPVTRR